MNQAPAAESLRLFYALWPDSATRDGLLTWQAPLQGRLTRFENLHLTLAFLGAQPVERLPALQTILAGLQPFACSMVLNRVGYFKRPRIVWAGMQEAPQQLMLLQRRLVKELAQHGIQLPDDFQPHVTLARAATPPKQAARHPVLWRADRLVLVQSSPGYEGAQYRIMVS